MLLSAVVLEPPFFHSVFDLAVVSDPLGSALESK
jgi:hypothetical protein